MTNDEALRKVKQAKTNLLLDEPFFGTLCYRLHEVPDEAARTFATNGIELRFAPSFVETLSIHEVMGVIAHEILHVTNGHCWREQGRDHKRFNVAADYAINPMLKDAGFILPQGALIDSQFNGMAAEQIYDLLPAGKDDDKQGKPDPNGEPGCGMGEFEQAPSEQTDQLDVEWKIATLQAAQAAQAAGKLPGSLKGLIESLKETRIDWRSATIRFAQEFCKSDYSWAMPNRRYLPGLYLPALRDQQMGEIVVGIDTSGSTRHVLPAFGANLQVILDIVRPRLMRVIYADYAVQYVETYEPGDIIKLRSDGGGGTSFVPLFEHIEAEHIEPACLIYLTDLEGDFPEQGPSYPVLWASTEKHVAPFGETLYIDPRD
jgi:predicted metal-dependent peptidase